MALTTCDVCSASLEPGRSCEDDFHQMLYWEAEYPELGIVHHLMVTSYYIQHPHLYSPDGLKQAHWQLQEFVGKGVTPQAMREYIRADVDSGKWAFKIKGTPESHGSYEQPMPWTMHACDVVAAGHENYIERVRDWANSIVTALHSVDLLETT